MNNTIHEEQETMTAVAAALAEHIKPLLPGAAMSGPFSGDINPTFIVCYDTKHKLRIYVPPELNQYFVFDRTYPFSESERVFVEKIACDIHNASLGADAKIDSIMADSVSQAVVRHVAPDYSETLLKVIKAYEAWADNDGRIGHTIGIRPMRKGKGLTSFFILAEQGLVKALGASSDTLVVLDDAGGIYNVEKIPFPVSEDKRRQDILAPVAYANIAVWANSRRKVAVRLTENGSILLFNKGRMLFVKHGGRWYSLPHTLIQLEPIPESIDGVLPETVRAVYLTALDMATGRDTARIGLVRCAGKLQPPSILRKIGIRLSAGNSSKNAKLLASMTNAQKFYELPRTIRADICALGGTVLLDGFGNILGLDASGADSSMAELLFSSGGSTGRAFPGSAYMELFNRNSQLNLHLAIR